MTKENEYFWQQYDGTVRALDLPLWYKKKDTRIYCVNDGCFFKDHCLFWQRYDGGVFHIAKRDIINDQDGKRKRPVYDKNYPIPHYFNASFGFYAEQKVATPCENFSEKEWD